MNIEILQKIRKLPPLPESVIQIEKLWKNHIELLLKEYLRGMRNIDDDLKKLETAYNNPVVQNATN